MSQLARHDRRAPGWGLGLFAILAAGTALRFWQLGHQDLWLDEIATWMIAVQPLHGIVTEVFRIEPNPPLFYVLAHAVIRQLGDSETALRLVSVVASSLTIVAVYAVGAAAFSRWAGLFAAGWMTVSGGALDYAQEARSYALTSLLETLAVLGLALAVRPLSAPGERAGNRGGWALFTLAAAGSVYSHYTATFFVASCGACAGVYLFAFGRYGCLWRLVCSGTAVGLLCAPALYHMTHLQSSELILYMPRLDAASALNLCIGRFGYVFFHLGQPWPNLLVESVWIGGLVFLSRRKPIILLLGGILVFTILIMYVVSVLYTPILNDRTIFPLTSLFTIILGAIVSFVPNWRYRLALCAILLPAALVASGNYYARIRSSDRYRQVASFLAQDMRAGDLAVGNPGIAYYRNRIGADFPLMIVHQGIPKVDVPGFETYVKPHIDLAGRNGRGIYVVTILSDAEQLFDPGQLQTASDVKQFGRDVVYIFR